MDTLEDFKIYIHLLLPSLRSQVFDSASRPSRGAPRQRHEQTVGVWSHERVLILAFFSVFFSLFNTTMVVKLEAYAKSKVSLEDDGESARNVKSQCGPTTPRRPFVSEYIYPNTLPRDICGAFLEKGRKGVFQDLSRALFTRVALTGCDAGLFWTVFRDLFISRSRTLRVSTHIVCASPKDAGFFLRERNMPHQGTFEFAYTYTGGVFARARCAAQGALSRRPS